MASVTIGWAEPAVRTRTYYAPKSVTKEGKLIEKMARPRGRFQNFSPSRFRVGRPCAILSGHAINFMRPSAANFSAR